MKKNILGGWGLIFLGLIIYLSGIFIWKIPDLKKGIHSVFLIDSIIIVWFLIVFFLVGKGIRKLK